MPYPAARFDYIAPEDIGAVSGALLAKGREELVDGKGVIVLFGPQMLAQEEALRAIAAGVGQGKEVEVANFADDEEAVQFVAENQRLPEFAARQLVSIYHNAAEGVGRLLRGPP